jgi:hypothetical protein
MGPQPEGGPSGDSRAYGGPQSGVGDGRYQGERENDPRMQGQQQRFIPGAFPDGKAPASPAPSNHGKDRDVDTPRASGERERLRTHGTRKGSGQMRICKKCGEPLTGQFVRALGGTFHLDCFKCKVSNGPVTKKLHGVQPLNLALYRTVDK